MRALLDQHVLGRIFRFESRYERWRPEIAPGWREEPAREEAGGVLFDLGGHLVDQALVLFGRGDVYSEIALRRAGALVEDDVSVALTHGSGVRSHLWMRCGRG